MMPASGSNCIHVCQISKKRFDAKDILTSLQNAVWNEIYALAVSTIGPHLSSLTTNRDTMVQTRRQQAEQGNVAPQQPSPEKPAPKKAVPKKPVAKKPVVKKPAVKKPVVKKPTPQQPKPATANIATASTATPSAAKTVNSRRAKESCETCGAYQRRRRRRRGGC